MPARIRELIRHKGLSQREFARAVGLDPTKLSKSLNGTRKFTEADLEAIAQACGVTLAYLREGDPRGGPSSEGPALVGKADARREQILAAAARQIADRGFNAVRIADVAAECGTSRAAVHYYFPTKLALLNEALGWCATQLFGRVHQEIRATDDPEHQLRSLIETQLPASAQVREEWSVWIQFWAEVCHRPELREVHRAIYQQWLGLLTEVLTRLAGEGRIPSDDPQRAATRLSLLIDGGTAHLLTGVGDFDLDEFRALLLAEAGL